jgi:hypothetical protein
MSGTVRSAALRRGSGPPRARSRGGGRLRRLALIEQATAIGRTLRHLGLSTDLPVARPARAPPLLVAAGEAHADEYESRLCATVPGRRCAGAVSDPASGASSTV